jgi:hypothetical protein
VPALTSPAANALTTDLTPLLDWGNSTGNLTDYQVQVATNAAFTTPVEDELTGATSQFTPLSDLGSNATHWWRVRAWNGTHYSLWSAVRTFRTALDAPSGLTSADKELTTRPTFDWDWTGSGTPPTNYTIQISTASTFASTVVNATTTPSQYTTVIDLPKGVMLYWRVRANGANGPSLWADGGSWPSANPPSVPALTSPAANVLMTDFTPRLDWGTSTGTLTDYQLQVATDAAFTSLALNEMTGSTSEFTPSVDLNPTNATYWWRVRSWNGTDYSLWSAVRTFRLALEPVVIIAPLDSETVMVLRPLIDWTWTGDGTAPTNYTLQVSASSLFTTFLINATVAGTEYTPTANLPTNKVLDVRVRANGPNGPSVWTYLSFIIIP